ncbi:MAG: hypothetical protein JWO36_3637 [Myxococcales bacterium]|nr:hypothetical protein [Myxococcales bacterium]
MTRWSWAAIIAIGCGHAAPSPPPPILKPVATDAAVSIDAQPIALDDDLPRLAARALELFQAWATALEESGEDCAAATAKIDAIADRYADVITANAKVMHAGRDKVKALRGEVAKHEEQFDAAAKQVVQSKAMAACHDDRAFAKAIDRVGAEQ